MFASMLLIACPQFVLYDMRAAIATGTTSAVCFATMRLLFATAVVFMLWFRDRTVVATPSGLELGLGNKRRVVPWEQVFDIREMPWIRGRWPWDPRMFQIDLSNGEAFDFVGVPKAREIVIEFVKQSEAKSAETPKAARH